MAETTIRKSLGDAVEYMIRHGGTTQLTHKNLVNGWVRRYIEMEMGRPIPAKSIGRVFRQMRQDGELVVKKRGSAFTIIEIRGMDAEMLLAAARNQPELF